MLGIGFGPLVGFVFSGTLLVAWADIVCSGIAFGIVAEAEVAAGGWEEIDIVVEIGEAARWGIECMEEELRRPLSQHPLHRSMARE